VLTVQERQLVCPPVLHEGQFAVAAADHIDHNLSSNTAQSSFHGTAISLTQFPVTEYKDNRQDLFDATASESVSDIVLPVSFTDVSPCILPAADPMMPTVPVTFSQQLQNVTHVVGNC